MTEKSRTFRIVAVLALIFAVGLGLGLYTAGGAQWIHTVECAIAGGLVLGLFFFGAAIIRSERAQREALRDMLTAAEHERSNAARNLTESQRNEELLRSALEGAKTADLAKGRFLSMMSHEVRTPLNGVLGFAGLLLDTPLTPDQRDYVQTIRTSSDALIQLTSDILDFARIESGGLKLELQPTDLRACLEGALDLLAIQAAHKKVELVHSVDESVPAVVMLDEFRLRQVFVNLIGNAIKFTDFGQVEVRISAERQLQTTADWRLAIAVRDTGIGIAREDLALLFKPFSRLDKSPSRRCGGVGLGLAISQNLVQLMGGEIKVESSPGEGSHFAFTIRAAAVQGITRSVPDLSRLRVALIAPSGPFRNEFTALMGRWRVSLVDVSSLAELASRSWDAAFVEIDADSAVSPPASDPAFPARKMHAIVPISFPSHVRALLRPAFCQIINKPLHHEALLGILSGIHMETPAQKARDALGLTVLVVEDNVVNQRLVIKLLSNLGCKSTLAANGRIAIDELTRATAIYDLVLMDLHMPELDGLGAIEKMRAGEAGEKARSLWVTVLTADARKDQRDRVVAAGANDYLVKPVSLNELADSLRRYSEAKPR